MSKNRQTIQFQLLMIMLLMAMITVGLGVTSMWQSHQIASKTKEISQVWLPGVQHVLNLRAQANRLRRAEAELYTSAPELVDSADLQKEIASVRESIIDTENKLQALNTSGEGADLMQTYLAKRGEYFAFQDKMLALRNSADATSQQEAAKAYFKEYKKLFISVAETSGKVAKMFVKSSEAAHAEVAAMEERANYVNLAVMVGAVMLAVGLGWWLAHRLAASLRRAVAVAEQVAEGNLTVQIETHDKSEVGDVMRALLGMRNHLAEIVGKVRTDAEIVAHASAEISQGNLDLSTRTETQASSLEKTNHSILQFSESAAKNAGEAQQASALAQHASGVAASGGQAMTAVVETMAQISNSSHRIADIISVIEGIAFQTNILALNAAVEAARAGEEGRGFAVVAGEVRSLAQRSANAAKEIKSLIDESVAHVSVGGSQVKDAGATVGELVDAIGKVSSLVSNIASSSAAQAADVREVSHAVQEMDTMTQQNAALVEEAAAAAASLRQQSDSLLEVMRVFQLEAPGHAAAPHAAVA